MPNVRKASYLLAVLAACSAGRVASAASGHFTFPKVGETEGVPRVPVSWNRAVTCVPVPAGLAGLAAAEGPGIPDGRALAPPCGAGGRRTFVEVRDARVAGPPAPADCEPGGTVWCDAVLELEDASVPAGARKAPRVRAVVDRAWRKAGQAPAVPPAGAVVDVQGFLHRDAEGRMELRPVTAWRPARRR